MATTFTIQRTGACSSGEHHIITVTQGAKVRTFHVDSTFLSSPVQDEEIEAVLRVLIRAGIAQLTRQQAGAKLAAGFNVVID